MQKSPFNLEGVQFWSFWGCFYASALGRKLLTRTKRAGVWAPSNGVRDLARVREPTPKSVSENNLVREGILAANVEQTIRDS
jgi:hypothetical protein